MRPPRPKTKQPRRLRSSACVLAVCLCAAALVLGGAAAVIHAERAQRQAVSSSGSKPQPSSSQAASSSQTAVKAATTGNIPVLMYHSINYDPKFPGNQVRIPKAKFAAQMKWLHDNGYHTLTMSELYKAVENREQVPEKSVVLTFDDGYEDNYQNAYPILQEYGFKATIFMITNEIGDNKNGYLTAEELKTMQQNGIDIECHTVHHLHLSKLSYQKQEEEISDAQQTLEKLLGRRVSYIAYPYGDYNAETLRITEKCGFKLGFREDGGIGRLSDPKFEFPRIFIRSDFSEFVARVTGAEDLRTSAGSVS